MSAAPVVVGIGEILWDVFPDDAHLGGAPANFACHAAALGDDAWIVSAVGQDDLGDRAVEQLQVRGVCCDAVAKLPWPTGRVDVTLDDARQASYRFAADCAWDHLGDTAGLESLRQRCNAVCFGSLGQRSAGSREAIRRFVRGTRRDALRVFDVNLRQQFFDRDVIVSSLRLASVVKLNDDELPVVAGLCELPVREPEAMLRGLLEAYDLRLAALTCGAAGAILVARDHVSRAAAPDVRVVDTVGAGDAFTATLVHDLLLGVPLDAVNRHANAVAAFVCSQAGATPRIPRELEAA